MRQSWFRLVLAAALFVSGFAVRAQTPQMQHFANSKLGWVDMDVPGFAKGMQMAPIVGDPAAANQPYTLRLKFPAGYRFPAHFHPNAENLTVLSGSFLLEMGPKETGRFTTYGPGDYLFIPPNNPHSGGAESETVIQLHGIGPFEIKLVNPVK